MQLARKGELNRPCLYPIHLVFFTQFSLQIQTFCASRAHFLVHSNPASWTTGGKETGGAPQLKGARWFSYDELKKCTNNFSESNQIGSGGYGKVTYSHITRNIFIKSASIKQWNQEQLKLSDNHSLTTNTLIFGKHS